MWLRRKSTIDALTDLATRSEELTHEMVDTLAGDSDRVRAHIRALLVQADLLPGRDERLARYDSSVEALLKEAPELHRPVLQRFVAWHQRPALLLSIERQGQLREAQLTTALQALRVSGDWLAWIEDKGTCLTEVSQSEIDEWFSLPPSTRTLCRPFVVWAAERGLIAARLRVPHRQARHTPILSEADRISLVRTLVTDNSLELRTRTAGLILLLYGQPLSRICALRNENIVSDEEGLWLRIGQQRAPIPFPFAMVFQAYLDSERPNTRLYNKASPFLFPGQKVGNSISVNQMHGSLNKVGIDILPSRNKALLEHVKTCPAPIVAEMLGYTAATIEKRLVETATPYARYPDTRRADTSREI